MTIRTSIEQAGPLTGTAPTGERRLPPIGGVAGVAPDTLVPRRRLWAVGRPRKRMRMTEPRDWPQRSSLEILAAGQRDPHIVWEKGLEARGAVVDQTVTRAAGQPRAATDATAGTEAVEPRRARPAVER
jgi:hypothetical protein